MTEPLSGRLSIIPAAAVFDTSSGHHDGQTSGRSRSHRAAQTFELTPENFSIQEDQGREGLILRGGRHLAIDRKMREEFDDLEWPHLVRVSDAVVVNVPPDPADVGLLGSQGVVADATRRRAGTGCAIPIQRLRHDGR